MNTGDFKERNLNGGEKMRTENIREGTEFTVVGFEEESPIIKKLKAMGLKEGKRVKLLLKNGRVYLLKLNNTRLVVDRELFEKIKKEVS